MTFCERILSIRQKAELSQEGFAEKLGVSRQSVSKWETGQAYPETDKLIEICDLFDVSLDWLIRGDDTPVAKKGVFKKFIYVILALTLVIAGLLITLFIPEKTVDKNFVLPEIADINTYFFDLAREYRFDYVPFFEEGEAPVDSPEYLYFAFAINLENWGDQKGTMSREYIDDVVLEHFAVPSLNHLSMRKAWDFDGEKYTAYPESIAEAPLYRPTKYTTYTKNGIQHHEVTLDCYSSDDGYIPSEDAVNNFRNGSTAGFSVTQTERFTFTLNYFGKPVFKEHIIIDS